MNDREREREIDTREGSCGRGGGIREKMKPPPHLIEYNFNQPNAAASRGTNGTNLSGTITPPTGIEAIK